METKEVKESIGEENGGGRLISSKGVETLLIKDKQETKQDDGESRPVSYELQAISDLPEVRASSSASNSSFKRNSMERKREGSGEAGQRKV